MAQQSIVLCLYGQPAFEALSGAKNPDAALLYVFAAASGGRVSPASAAQALDMSPDRLEKAAALLRLYGVAEGARPPQERTPDHPVEIAETRRRDIPFGTLCDYMEGALGRVLRKPELETLHHIYGSLGLPADVLVLLVNYCKENNRLSAREMEKQAYRWHDEGINSYSRAEAFLERQRARRSREWQIRKLLGLEERRPSDTEKKYIEGWTLRGLPDELIALAYDRTVGRTGKLSWAYMDKILTSWHQAGYRTAQAVLEGDKAPAKASPQPPGPGTGSVEATVLAAYSDRRRRREAQLKRRLTELSDSSPEFVDVEGRRRLCASRLARAPGPARPALESELEALVRERTALLERLGHPADWLDDRPACPDCGDRGYIGATMCHCFKQACEAERRRREAKPT